MLLGHIKLLNSKMALVIGHSQTKYFKNYFDSKDNVEVLCYPGCKVEDLVLIDEVAEAVLRASRNEASFRTSATPPV